MNYVPLPWVFRANMLWIGAAWLFGYNMTKPLWEYTKILWFLGTVCDYGLIALFGGQILGLKQVRNSGMMEEFGCRFWVEIFGMVCAFVCA